MVCEGWVIWWWWWWCQQNKQALMVACEGQVMMMMMMMMMMSTEQAGTDGGVWGGRDMMMMMMMLTEQAGADGGLWGARDLMMMLMILMMTMMSTEQAGADGGVWGGPGGGAWCAGGWQVGHIAHLPDPAPSHEAVQIPQRQVSPQGQCLTVVSSITFYLSLKAFGVASRTRLMLFVFVCLFLLFYQLTKVCCVPGCNKKKKR